jgi:hypothetical protein
MLASILLSSLHPGAFYRMDTPFLVRRVTPEAENRNTSLFGLCFGRIGINLRKMI